MEPIQLQYRLEVFEGPLDLLLNLIHKNKVEISDIPISLICDQYMEYLREAEEVNLDLASEFIVMASELMLIKSKMLLPRQEEEEEDPRAALADALLKFQQAKEAAAKLLLQYPRYSGRMVKDTDEISIDKTFVADQSVTSLCAAVRRIVAYQEERPQAEKVTFTPMISTPIVPVEVKIVQILNHMETTGPSTLKQLLDEAVSLPDMIAIFLGVLELIKIRRIRIMESEEPTSGINVLGEETQFSVNSDWTPIADTGDMEALSSDADVQT
jgi:segregation and condensation protein A